MPSLWLNLMFSQVNDTMGRRSLIMLLRRTGLPQYIDNLPPLDDSPSITVQEYSTLLADVYEIFGASAALDLFWHGGRLGSAELRHRRPTQFAVRGTALRLLSGSRRMRIILEQLAEQGREGYGATYDLREEPDAFFFDIAGCPYCAEIARRSQEQGKPVTKPVCLIPAAIIDEMVEWVTGQKHLVEETACIAQGAEACRFRINK